MTVDQLRVAIESALGAVPFNMPITMAYCEAVRDQIRVRAPGAAVEVNYRQPELVAEARLGAAFYKLAIPVG